MSSLVVVGFPKVDEAEQVRRELVDIQREQLIALEDAVVVEHDAEGQVHLRQSVNLTAAGALGGGFWGTLVGLWGPGWGRPPGRCRISASTTPSCGKWAKRSPVAAPPSAC
jgi:uncharacterized membrane protein